MMFKFKAFAWFDFVWIGLIVAWLFYKVFTHV